MSKVHTANLKVDDKNVEFRFTRFPPFESLELLGDLQRVLLPAAISTAPLTGLEELPSVELSGMLMDSAEALGRNLDGKTLQALVKRVLDMECILVNMDGKDWVKLSSSQFELRYDDASLLIELVVHALRHNYTDFFVRFGSHFTGLLPRAKTPAEPEIPLDPQLDQ